MLLSVDEFKTRHLTIKQNISETYRIGNRLLDYIEKQLIVDYHLRGEQQLLESNFPQLAEKAKIFLGHENYYEL